MTKRACIAIVDAAHARLYTYREDASDPADQLHEVEDLVNPGRRLKPAALFSDAGPRELGSTKDDHRDDHIVMMDAKFAKEIVAHIEHLLSAEHLVHVIVVASPKMLGELRKSNGVFHRAGIALDEVPRDLAKLTSPQLHDHLASLDLIPARQRHVVAR